jgi:predicted permease
MQTLWRDLQYALRILGKNPGFTTVVVLTLAMAIGANAVVFSVVNAMFLRPLNVPDSQTLFALERSSDPSGNQSYPDYLDLRDRNRSFDALAAYDVAEVGLDTGGNAGRAWVEDVSGNYFDVLRIQPYLGRLIHASDEQGPNSAPYIVLTYAYWHGHFQDDRRVVGRVVQLNKHPFTIIGVTPPAFHGVVLFFNPDVFVPIVNQEQVEGYNGLNDRGNRWVGTVMGHLKRGVTPTQAIADLNSIGSYLEKTYPKDDAKMSFVLVHPNIGGGYNAPFIQAFLTGLMLLTGLILLAACANLGSLFAARASDRSRELAVRLALGASRMRILRQLFTEAVLISLVGGAVGLWGSGMLLGALSVWQPVPRFPVSMPMNPDSHVYVVAFLLTIASGFLFGAVPVRQVLHTDPYQIVKEGSISKVGRRITLRDLLLAAQIAICAVLVTSSMVALRGLVRSLHRNFGFEPHNAMLVDTGLDLAGYSGDAVSRMQRRMIDAMAAIPGVTSVGSISTPPLHGFCCSQSGVFTDETTDLRPGNVAADAMMFSISPEYFSAAGTVLLAGRDFTWQDDKNSPRVTVINPEFARRLFGSVTAALGKYFKIPDGTRIQVVGIVEQGKFNTLAEDPKPAMFLPLLQMPSTQTFLVLRLDRDPGQLAPAIENALRNLDAGMPFYLHSWVKVMDFAFFAPRLATLALGVMGTIGALLSITGIFGLAAYSVSKRKRELGIRMAVGAQWKEVLQVALGRAFKLLAFGSSAGLLLGIPASRVLASIVYLATPRDPLVLTGTVLAMLLLGLVATWVPAQRALSIDPAILLREE